MSAALTLRNSLPMGVPRYPAKPRTLVVDDSPTILHAICSLLEHREVVDVVGRAESGQETISAVGELKPDLVLIDADMPGMSGLRTSLLLTQGSATTRVVLMSMDTTPQFKQACAGCGASAVIYKPKFLSELGKLLQAESGADWEKPIPRPRRKLRSSATIMR
jgi:DNA-binding NarL/FixJ family response regulator